MQSMVSAVSESQMDAASLVSQPLAAAAQMRSQAFTYEPAAGANGACTPARDTVVDTVTVTEQSLKIRNASHEEPSAVDDSNFVSFTEKAPSEHDILTISQRAQVRVDLSSDGCPTEHQAPPQLATKFRLAAQRAGGGGEGPGAESGGVARAGQGGEE